MMRVLMIGPNRNMLGGVAAVARTLVPVLEERVEVMYFPTVRNRGLKDSGKISLGNITIALSQYIRFIYALFRFHPHIIHLHTSQGIAWLKDTIYILVGRVFRSHIVVHVHAADFDELYGKRSRYFQHYTRKVLSLVDAVIAVSEEWSQILADIVPDGRVYPFKNCISVKDFTPNLSNQSMDGARAIFLGSIGPRKGSFDLIEAVDRLNPSECSIKVRMAGFEERQGDQLKAREMLKKMKLEDKCELVGIVQGVKKAEFIAQANLFILPSYDEGLPIAILEAMAAGLAVISTPVGGIPEVIKDGYNGFLVTPGDIDSLAGKLALLANDPHLREVMGRRSREIAEKDLDVNPYVGRMVQLYESLVEI